MNILDERLDSVTKYMHRLDGRIECFRERFHRHHDRDDFDDDDDDDEECGAGGPVLNLDHASSTTLLF